MRSRKSLLAFTALALLLAGVPRAAAEPAAPTLAALAALVATAAQQAPIAAIGVERLMKEPEKHPGTLVVEGVVKTVAAKDRALALIDVEEYRKCRVVTCSLLALPVRWDGEMPAVLDIVRVEGAVATVDGKLLFAARKLEKVPETKQP